MPQNTSPKNEKILTRLFDIYMYIVLSSIKKNVDKNERGIIHTYCVYYENEKAKINVVKVGMESISVW